MAIQIREHTPGKDIEDFIRVGHIVYGDDPAWVAPLEFDLRQRLTPSKNPFFHRGEVGLFTAWKDGKLVRSGAGPALVFSFLLLGVACALAALCYAELAAMIPHAGSAYAYAYSTLGVVLRRTF